MKITIYELLGLIKDGKAPKKIKELQGSYTETYVFDEKEQGYITKDGTTKMNIWNKERLSNEAEILEEVEDKEYEDIKVYNYVDNYEVMYPNTIANNFVHLNEDLQAITGAIKYILERLDK